MICQCVVRVEPRIGREPGCGEERKSGREWDEGGDEGSASSRCEQESGVLLTLDGDYRVIHTLTFGLN